jgi:hypothetical protein
MRRALPAALLLLALPAALPAAAEPPAALIEATEEAAALCSAFGGTPAILDGYRITRDLNGDGRDDFLIDLARLECGGAWSALCGSSGCPVSAWLSGPDGGYTRFDFGRLRGVEMRDAAPLPAVVARYAAPFCAAEAVEDCTRTWTFASVSPDTPPVDRPPEAAPAPAPAPEPEPAPAPEPEAAPAPAEAPVHPGLAGWTLRRIPGSSPVALGAGVGNVASLAVFCLSDQPFLAATFHQKPATDSVELEFAFSQGPVAAALGFEETAGGAYVAPLADGPLAARLAGRDREVALRAGAEDQGVLSLSGSSRTIRAAIGECHGF